MIKSIEVSGRTESDAIANALAQLGMDRDDVSVEILERAKPGFLGIGGTPAVVKVSYEAEGEDAPAPKAAPAAAPAPAAPAAERDESDADVKRLYDFYDGLFERMGVAASAVAVKDTEKNLIKVEFTGEHLGALIGRQGETLDAIQHLSNYIVNRGREDRVCINIDAENYRAKRADTLARLAHKVAAKVLKYRRSVTLEPMNAYERHIIHTALQDVEGVSTNSIGTEPNRRIVVSCDKPEKTDRYSTREWS